MAVLHRTLDRTLTARIITSAANDPRFRHALLADPICALADFMDIALPQDLSLTVVEETTTTIYLVLPATGEHIQTANRPPVEAQIIERAESDRAFRDSLLADPVATLQEHFGMYLPESITVRVLEENATTRYLVLPFDPAAPLVEQELSDDELLLIAGGGRTLRPGAPGCQEVNGMGRTTTTTPTPTPEPRANSVATNVIAGNRRRMRRC